MLFSAPPKSIVRQLSPQLQSLLGYSVLQPHIGMVDGVHPKRLLGIRELGCLADITAMSRLILRAIKLCLSQLLPINYALSTQTKKALIEKSVCPH